MRLFGVTMVRNEADVIEAYVRHNLTVLDGLVVIDPPGVLVELDVCRTECETPIQEDLSSLCGRISPNRGRLRTSLETQKAELGALPRE